MRNLAWVFLFCFLHILTLETSLAMELFPANQEQLDFFFPACWPAQDINASIVVHRYDTLRLHATRQFTTWRPNNAAAELS
jgi:hypothetical protein